MDDYYVYVYIDPRNNEEFYYGKGKGSRKNAHLESESDTEKTKRIAAIRKAGLEPTIRVVARGLTEHDAFLVEKAYLHKLGKSLTNISSGYYADKFRPHDTLHLEGSGFDYKSGVYYFNVGQGPHRQWADCRKHGFISAGQGAQWARAICGFNAGDIFAAYLKRGGFVGIGQITAKARPIREVKISGRPLVMPATPVQEDGRTTSTATRSASTSPWSSGSGPCLRPKQSFGQASTRPRTSALRSTTSPRPSLILKRRST